MSSDLDIYRTASTLVMQYGEDASLEAAERANNFLEDGDAAGSAIWRRVAKAIEEIERQGQHDGETVK